MASCAEIANDMAAHAEYWQRRDTNVGRVCIDAAALIRLMLDDEQVDGHRYHGVWRRLLDQERGYYSGKVQGWPNFGRARSCIEMMKANHQKKGSP